MKQEITRQALAQDHIPAQRSPNTACLSDRERENVHALNYELGQLEDDIVRIQKRLRDIGKDCRAATKKQLVIREVNAVKRQLIALRIPHRSRRGEEKYKAKLQREIEALLEITNSLTVVDNKDVPRVA